MRIAYIILALVVGVVVGMIISTLIMVRGSGVEIAKALGVVTIDTVYVEVVIPPDTIVVKGETTYKEVKIIEGADSTYIIQLLDEIDVLYAKLRETETEKFSTIDTTIRQVDYILRMAITHELVYDRWYIYQELGERRRYLPLEQRTITITMPPPERNKLFEPYVVGPVGVGVGILLGVLITK